MKTINRTVVTVRGKKPFIEWANSFDYAGPKMDIGEINETSFLIPDTYDELNYEKFIKTHYKLIFETELDSWMIDPEVWPQDRTYTLFRKWFEVRVSDLTFDLAEGQIKVDTF